MAAILANEGRALIAQWLCGNIVTDKGTNLQLGLFTNASITTSTGLASITEPTGGGYARKTLTDGSWTGAADLRSYVDQTFTAGTGGMTGAIRGAFICSTGASPKLITSEVNPAGPITLAVGDTYDVSPSVLIRG